MPKDDTKDDKIADTFQGEKFSSWLQHLLAEEDELDGRMMWRLASWGVGSVAALVVAILAAQSSFGFQRSQTNTAELARQAQQVQWVAKESQNEARRLAAAVETLNTDRDRLYSRVTVLEQGLDTVTGSIAQQKVTGQPADQGTTTSPASVAGLSSLTAPDPVAPAVKPVTTTAAAKSAGVPPVNNKAATLPDLVASIPPPNEDAGTVVETAIKPTAFGVELGGANSVEGLRALWRSAVKSNKPLLGALQPIIVFKESNDGLGMRLRLVAGPFVDAAATAKLCAALMETKRTCETSVFDGQRLAMNTETSREPGNPAPRKRSKPRAEQASPTGNSFTSIFGVR